MPPSTNLSLHDTTWPTHNTQPYNPRQILRSSREMREEMAAYNIGQMRHYMPGEEETERVSTRLKLFSYPWIITKTLTHSDLNHLSRLLIPINLVDSYIMPLLPSPLREKVGTEEGLPVKVWDFDTNSIHDLVFKKWLSSNSYVFIGNWPKEFVRRRQLAIGYQIEIYWDPFYSRFNFRLLNRA